MKAALTDEGYKKRLSNIRKVRSELMKKDINSLHVKLQKGNSKTGANCYTCSLLPVIDCVYCNLCASDCYDLKSVMRFKSSIVDRSRNSIIHEKEPQRFWDEVNMQVKLNCVMFLRINVGGDLKDYDFKYVKELGKNNPKCQFMFFTKNYKGINKFLEKDSFPPNIHPLMSAWKGMEMDNKFHLPEAHILYENGETTAPKNAKKCNGSCTECSYNDTGCWTLKANEHVVFKHH